VPNIQIYLHSQFHIFLRSLSIFFPDSIFTLCNCKTVEKEKYFSFMGHLPLHWPSSRSPLSHRCQWAPAPSRPHRSTTLSLRGPTCRNPLPSSVRQSPPAISSLRCPVPLPWLLSLLRPSQCRLHARHRDRLVPSSTEPSLAQAAPYRAGVHATAATPLCHRDATDKPLAAKSSAGHLAESYGIAAEQATI
jgi:hypothetical protein